MCGISGIISKLDIPIDQNIIKKINDIILHRGPDDEGYYFGNNFAFGHRRLAILDLSSRGHQPMNYLTRYWITYNGEIYNYLEIREELLGKGYSFQTSTDTEVILAAYAAWGPDCLSKFNGMWAFAIYDAIDNVIFMSRDRFGIKPLYYLETPEYFAFGSEIKQLLALQSSVRANRKIVIESLLTSIDGHNSDTFFEGIKTFPQSHCGIYDLKTHSFKIDRYYELETNPLIRTLSFNDAIVRFRELFEDAVRIRLRSDVRVGTCLSGGLDSSATSGIASRIYHETTGEKFLGIHAKSIDIERDESSFASQTAECFGIDLHFVEPRTSDFLATIEDLVYTQEEPFGSPSMFMGWHVFQKAKTLDCKVMLNGQGGDEVLLGYERYFAAFLKSLSLLQQIKEARAQAKNSKLNLKNIFQYYFYFTNPTLRIQRLKNRSMLLQKYKKTHKFETIRRSAKSFRNIENLQIFEIATLQLPHLLRYEDRNSMRHSIETRLPFLDYRLVEFCTSISPEYKIHGGWTKYILRKSMDNVLPKPITWRKDKLGFEAPERTWLGDSLEFMKNKISTSQILKIVTDHKRLLNNFESLSLKEKWRYFCLAAWEETFGVEW